MINKKTIEKLETPFYVINYSVLEKNYKELKKALEDNWNNYIIGYSYKTNSLPWIIQFFKSNNCYSEVVSKDEYELGKLLKIDKDRFIYNGPIKDKESFLDALKNGCYLNIDSQRELDWLCSLKENYKVGLRVNFDLEKYCPNQSQCGDEGGRFGFCYENKSFEKALKQLKDNNMKLSGLHLHVSSKTRGLDVYKTISEIAVKIIEEYSLNLDYIDIGGGFFGGLPNKPRFNDYIKLVSSILKRVCDPQRTKLIVEPGISLVGTAISYFSRVIDIKDTTYNRFVLIDGSRTNMDPLMSKDSYYHNYIKITDTKRTKKRKQVICGSTCMEHDRLFVENNFEELKVGDIVEFNNVGAYTMCLTPLFITYFPDVYALKNNKLELIREKWTAKEYIQKTVIGDDKNECINN